MPQEKNIEAEEKLYKNREMQGYFLSLHFICYRIVI